MNATRSALLSVCVLVAAVGCASGDDKGATPETSSSTAAAATEESTSTTAASSSTSRVKPGHLLTAFQTPSGKVFCGVYDAVTGTVRCDVLAAAVKYTPPPKPASCEFDWGMSFAIKPDGSVEPLCVSDALADRYETAPAGSSKTIGASVCAFKTDSVRCVAEGTDGGLFLSPERFENF